MLPVVMVPAPVIPGIVTATMTGLMAAKYQVIVVSALTVPMDVVVLSTIRIRVTVIQ